MSAIVAAEVGLDRGDVDDRATFPLRHVPSHGLGAEEWPPQIDAQDLIPLRHGQIEKLAQGIHAGIGDQRVDMAELGQ